ncbi:hypothetical protein XENOCAPTIV_016804 [Xenoophorus captivus]|uniref:Uncharacterized protein n=1 Tax=Xenoophorus captivus TaxID=1517983 RepID=A0ABV0Q5A2_9TELE
MNNKNDTDVLIWPAESLRRLLTDMSRRQSSTPSIRRVSYKRSSSWPVSVLHPCILVGSLVEGKTVVENSEAKPIQKFGEDSQGMHCSWSDCFKSNYSQTYLGYGL